ncbi:serine dehydratase beta chain, partial [Streptomyces chartreusis]
MWGRCVRFRKAERFSDGGNEGVLSSVASIRSELYGSLGATGHGHGTPKA